MIAVLASAWSVGGRVLAGTVLAVLVTIVSLRLLGIRRGWGTALLSGVLGWTAALVVALGVSGWDWGADGLVLQLIAIGIPAAMATAVGLDLLARPGTLAVGERAGLVVTPRPLRAARTRVEVFRRYRELLRLARKEGFGPMTAGNGGLDSQAIRLRRVLEGAGGVYVKLGQIAATRVDLLPAELCAELATLQNRVPPESRDDIAAVLEAELGPDLDAVFAEFEWEPLAAASIGQTHRARLRTGEAVVVKVQRPGIEATMERDLAALALVAELAQRRTVFGRGVRSGEMLAQFAMGLRAELDFLREADAMAEMASRLGPDCGIRVPLVHRHLCTRRVLVQERFEGRTVSDSAPSATACIDRPALAEHLVRTTLDQVMRIGFFHADPHPGNVFVLEDGTLGLIDFGATGRLDPIQQSAIVDMLIALARRDVGLLRDGVERISPLAEDASSDELERVLARLMATHVRPGGNIEPDVMQELVVVLTGFGIRLPTDVVLLARALVTIDGTLRVLCPGSSLMSAAMQLLEAPKVDAVVDRQELARDELLAVLPHLRRLPERVDRILTLAARGELRVRTVIDEDGRRIVRTLVNRVLLGGIGAAILAVAAVLLVANDPGPAVGTGTGLFEIFGYGGLLAGAVLVLRVVAAVARDGTT